jgi:hypothetical protein
MSKHTVATGEIDMMCIVETGQQSAKTQHTTLEALGVGDSRASTIAKRKGGAIT